MAENTENTENTVIQRYVTALGDQDWPVLKDLYAPDVVLYTPFAWGVKGVEFLLKFCEEVHRAHPGVRAVLHDEFYSADGTRAAFRFALHWHNTGPYFGHEPTGERGTSIEQHTVRLENGKIVEQVVGVSALQLHLLQKEAWGMEPVRDVVDPGLEIVSAPAAGGAS
ncbi:ester cyclase [Streptomyces sp. B93]|uniref:ester cyclase n=1 Tax=Streptomyces sp. B93 TaxID=2824875 RepID=UPI001B36A4A5|nr:nuclear transport factor 2 family protein [Streptomyces sp. B93]MBQ1093367.1 nuclear transport factor 2 family protein [Streptomyces sp. B93]